MSPLSFYYLLVLLPLRKSSWFIIFFLYIATNLFTTTHKIMDIVWIKSYPIAQLEKKEKLNYRTIKKRTDIYIPVLFEHAQSRARQKQWKAETPYSVKYIKATDFYKYMRKRHGKTNNNNSSTPAGDKRPSWSE